MNVWWAALALVWVAAGVWNSVTPGFNDVLFRDEHLTFFRPHLPLHTLTREIGALAQSGDALVLESPLHSWAIAGAFDLYTHPLPVRATLSDQLTGDENTYGDSARAFIGDSTRVWLAVEHNAPPTYRLTAFEHVLEQSGFAPCDSQEINLPGLTAQLYTLSTACCCPPESLDAPEMIHFGDGVMLTHVEPPPEHVNGMLNVVTAWAVDASVPSEAYSVALHVLDSNGNLTVQVDFGLPGERFACRRATIALDGVPPGNYTLVGVVYDWRSGARLPVSGGDSARLGTFIVDDGTEHQE